MMRDSSCIIFHFTQTSVVYCTITHLYYFTSIIPYLLIRVFITNGPFQVIITCVCERDQEEERHDTMTGSSNTMAKIQDGKTGKWRHQRNA